MSGITGPRIILHCDLDAFYPSCEIKRNPSFAGKPLIVGADPKGGHGRGVLMSCSHQARKVKAELKTAEGLTVSVGVAPNKSIAKMASDMNKPDGLTTVKPEEVRTFLEPLSVNKISGVGKKTTEFLQEHGIQTIGQLSQIPAKKLTDWLGKGAVWLWGIANGIEEAPVEERGLRKSISVEQTFERDVQNKQVVLEAL